MGLFSAANPSGRLFSLSKLLLSPGQFSEILSFFTKGVPRYFYVFDENSRGFVWLFFDFENFSNRSCFLRPLGRSCIRRENPPARLFYDSGGFSTVFFIRFRHPIIIFCLIRDSQYQFKYFSIISSLISLLLQISLS